MEDFPSSLFYHPLTSLQSIMFYYRVRSSFVVCKLRLGRTTASSRWTLVIRKHKWKDLQDTQTVCMSSSRKIRGETGWWLYVVRFAVCMQKDVVGLQAAYSCRRLNAKREIWADQLSVKCTIWSCNDEIFTPVFFGVPNYMFPENICITPVGKGRNNSFLLVTVAAWLSRKFLNSSFDLPCSTGGSCCMLF